MELNPGTIDVPFELNLGTIGVPSELNLGTLAFPLNSVLVAWKWPWTPSSPRVITHPRCRLQHHGLHPSAWTARSLVEGGAVNIPAPRRLDDRGYSPRHLQFHGLIS